MKKRNALYLYMGQRSQMGGVNLYRISTPANAIKEYSDSWDVAYCSFADVSYRGHQLSAFFSQFDLVIFPRLFFPAGTRFQEELAKIIRLLRALDIRIAYETDDDYTNDDRIVIDGDATEIMRWCDGLIVTQHLLGQKLQKRSGRPYYICPNSIQPVIWDNSHVESFRRTEKVTILLSGSETHYEDWRVLERVMPAILASYGDTVVFYVMGYHPDYLMDLPHTAYLPAMTYVEYAQVVRASDIILAPVVPDDGFNLGKSPIKAIEGMGASRIVNGTIAGGAVVATDNPVYRLAVRHNKTGLLVNHTATDWHCAIESLILDAELRHRLQHGAYAHAWKHYNYEKTWVKWVRAFNRIVDNPANKLVLPSTDGG